MSGDFKPCDTLRTMLDRDEGFVKYDEVFNEYYLIVPAAEEVRQVIFYCPWCGDKLPESLRDRWFDEVMETYGSTSSSHIDPKYHSDRWWRSVGNGSSAG